MKLALILGTLALGGCAWFVREEEGSVGRETDTHRVPSEGRRTAVDPVSGDPVRTDTFWRTDYDERTYYFTSRETMERFQRRPADFVDSQGRPKRASAN